MLARGSARTGSRGGRRGKAGECKGGFVVLLLLHADNTGGQKYSGYDSQTRTRMEVHDSTSSHVLRRWRRGKQTAELTEGKLAK